MAIWASQRRKNFLPKPHFHSESRRRVIWGHDTYSPHRVETRRRGFGRRMTPCLVSGIYVIRGHTINSEVVCRFLTQSALQGLSTGAKCETDWRNAMASCACALIAPGGLYFMPSESGQLTNSLRRSDRRRLERSDFLNPQSVIPAERSASRDLGLTVAALPHRHRPWVPARKLRRAALRRASLTSGMTAFDCDSV